MKNLPKISDAEWQVMKILWANTEITANEIVEKLATTTEWKPKTIRALLSRLLNKKAISFKADGRTYLYYSLVTESECVQVESKSFVNRFFGGSVQLMIANFIEDDNLSDETLEELKRILERKKLN